MPVLRLLLIVENSKVNYLKVLLAKNIAAHKGLVIFNPALGGWSRGKGGQKYLETSLRGFKNFLYFFKGG